MFRTCVENRVCSTGKLVYVRILVSSDDDDRQEDKTTDKMSIEIRDVVDAKQVG